MSYENLTRFFFSNTRQKEASIEQDATLVIDCCHILTPKFSRITVYMWTLRSHDVCVCVCVCVCITVCVLLYVMYTVGNGSRR